MEKSHFKPEAHSYCCKLFLTLWSSYEIYFLENNLVISCYLFLPFFLIPLLYLAEYTFIWVQLLIPAASVWFKLKCVLQKWNLFSFPTLIFTTEKKDSLQKWLEIKTGDPKAWVWRCVYIHQGRDLRTTQSELQNPWRLNLSFFKAGCLHLKYYLLNIVGEQKT